MKLLYKPFALVGSVVAARLAKKLFLALWSRIDSGEPPKATARDATMAKVVAASTLEAATNASIGTATHRASALVFQRFFGVWPGPEPEEED